MNTPRTDQSVLFVNGTAYVPERELTACKLDLEAEERGQDNLRSLLAAKSAECQRLREALESLVRPLEHRWRVSDMDDRIREARAALQEPQP